MALKLNGLKYSFIFQFMVLADVIIEIILWIIGIIYFLFSKYSKITFVIRYD